MTLQHDLLEFEYLEEISAEKSAELHKALEDLLALEVDLRYEAMTRLREMDAHLRSPLAISFLVGRLNEPYLNLRAEIVHSINEVIVRRSPLPRPSPRVQNYLQSVLRELGEREIYSLLELMVAEQRLLEPICAILNQCSMSGEILMRILGCPEVSMSIRTASCEVIGQIGFLDARQTIESLERRLSERTSGQLPMPFAPQANEEAKGLIPVLRRTLDALREASI
jgi:hypothetical protein